jgi:CheY-like chemotaxis protein
MEGGACGTARPVLSDVMMPVLDGFGLLARIKNDAHTRGAGDPALCACR